MTRAQFQPSAEFGLSPGELRLVVVGAEWAARFAEERSRIPPHPCPLRCEGEKVAMFLVRRELEFRFSLCLCLSKPGRH